MLIDGIKLPLTAEIVDTVTTTADRVNTLPGTVTNGRVIELLVQDGANAPGIYEGIGGVWVAQADSITEKLTAVEDTVTDVETLNTTVSGLQFYDVAGNISGKPDASASVLKLVSPRAFTIPAGFTSSYAVCATASNASASFTIKRWNTAHTSATTLGNINFVSGNKIGSVVQSGSGSMPFVAGETLEIVAPSSQDTTLADIAFVISSTLV